MEANGDPVGMLLKVIGTVCFRMDGHECDTVLLTSFFAYGILVVCRST
jgi:hypothetical protein